MGDKENPWNIFYTLFILFQIKDYYKFKQKHRDIYDGLVPSREKNVFEQNVLLVLPNRDQCGRRILVIELGSKYINLYGISLRQFQKSVVRGKI